MELERARAEVIEAGKKLVERGLIARTWGNVSCRISSTRFVITPSGKPYQSLMPQDIVPVRIEDGSYEGAVEPSSEAGVHAEIYRRRPGINFIIHTHQPCASVVSVLREDIDPGSIDSTAPGLLEGKVLSIPYALPGSSSLRLNVARALEFYESKAYLLTAHGALCLGKDSLETFKVAFCLEKICLKFIEKKYFELAPASLAGEKEKSAFAEIRKAFVLKQAGELRQGEAWIGPDQSSEPYHFDPLKYSKAELEELDKPKHEFYNSIREGDKIKLYPEGTDGSPFPDDRGVNLLAHLEDKQCSTIANATSGELITDNLTGFYQSPFKLHRSIYSAYSNIKAVIHARSPNILAVSKTGMSLKPMFDDFAQIIGIEAAVVNEHDETKQFYAGIIPRLEDCSAVLIENSGAICCGTGKSDVEAAAMILDKNCKAYMIASLLGKAEPISFEECNLMRKNYIKSYSKKMKC